MNGVLASEDEKCLGSPVALGTLAIWNNHNPLAIVQLDFVYSEAGTKSLEPEVTVKDQS
jgi:hypothetical protein